MENDTTDKLYSVVLHSKHTVCSLSHNCKCLHQYIIQRLSSCKPVFKLLCLCLQLFIRKRLHLFIKCLYCINDRSYLFKFLLAVRSKYFLKQTHVVFDLLAIVIQGTF